MSSKISSDELNLYFNFIARALVPLQSGDADAFYSEYEESVNRVAKALRAQLGCPGQIIYRGILLEGFSSATRLGRLIPIEHIRYLSFSESPEVAKRFADPADSMAFSFRLTGKRVTGYLMEYQPPPEEVLFHWRWAESLHLSDLGIPYYNHETVLEQKEVIIRQNGKEFPLKPA